MTEHKHWVIALAMLLGGGGVAWATTTTPAAQTGDRVVAVVNQQPITWREWDRRMQMVRQRNPGQALPADVGQQVLEVLVQERAMVQEAQAMGIRVTDDEVANAERALAQQNQLTLSALRDNMARDGISPQAYAQQLRQQLLLQRAQAQIAQERVQLSEGEVTRYLLTRAPRAPERIGLAQWLVPTPEDASPAQLEAARQRAEQIAQAAKTGTPWAELGGLSVVPNASKAQSTDLGWRNTNDWPELFVRAVAGLTRGQVSEVVRSGAGFHVLQLTGRAAPGVDLHLTLTQARHILLRPTEQLSMPAIMAQLSRWRQQVVAGQADFAALAKAHSQDGSAAQGGDLGWAQPGQFVPEFEQAMNTLAVGEVSQPVVSRFGVHLIQVVQRRQEPMTEAQQREWARQQLREQRAPLVYNAWATEVRAKAYVKVLAPDL